jgi:hypothetical protein
MNKNQVQTLKNLISSYSYCAKNGSLDKLLHISDNVYLFNILNNLESKLIKMEKANDGTGNQPNDSQ